jgi:uncharacterized protein
MNVAPLSGGNMPTVEQARSWYDARDPVHGFDHVLRVLRLAEKFAAMLGADVEIVRAAALLHDATGAAPAPEGSAANAELPNRNTHHLASAEFARRVLTAEGWSGERLEAVLHCIRAHRYRGEEAPTSREAEILFDADKLDVLGAFGVARTIGYALQAGQPVYAEPSPRFVQSGQEETGEPHSAYHEYLFKLRKVAARLHTQPARQLAARRVRLLEAFFEQLAAEARGLG